MAMNDAGSTLPRLNSDGQECCWGDCNAEEFLLRVGPDYNLNKKKDSSPSSIFNVVGVDFYKSDQRIDNIGSKVRLPKEWTSYDSEAKQLGISVPPLLILNFQVPIEVPTSWFLPLFTTVDDGPTYSVIIYCRMSENTETALLTENKDTIPGAIRLMEEYLQSFVHDYNDTKNNKIHEKFYGRLKLILNCKNLDQFGLPSFITSYNAKPVLIRNTINLIHGEGYNEIDINVHKFSSIPKQALQHLYSRFHLMKIEFGFCVESREEEDMPETIAGCFTMHNIHIEKSTIYTPTTSTTTTTSATSKKGEEVNETTAPDTPTNAEQHDTV